MARGRRQGISITYATRSLVENCAFLGSRGTVPESGVNLEPNHSEACPADICFLDTEFSDNAGVGILVRLPWLTETSPPVNVLFKGCRVSGTGVFIGWVNVPACGSGRPVRPALRARPCTLRPAARTADLDAAESVPAMPVLAIER